MGMDLIIVLDPSVDEPESCFCVRDLGDADIELMGWMPPPAGIGV
jgi:hypothetical protein